MSHARSVLGSALLAALLFGLGGCEADPDPTPEVVPAVRGGRYELHPYFGYTYAGGREGVNRHGFESGGREYPYRAADGEFVVGVFGGTAAQQIAKHEAEISAALLPAVRAKGYDRVTVLPFAVEGWRQPQTFHAFVKYLPDIDVAIVVDGLSEVVEFADADVPGWPGDFPAAKIYGQLSGQLAGRPAAGTSAERASEYFAAWEDRIRLMDLIGLERSKPVLHFVQPNPFAGEEGADAKKLAGVAAAAYDEMRGMTERLSGDGVASHLVEDLIGGRTEVDLYEEECCDLTDKGAASVAQAVAEEVEMSQQMEEVVPAAERPSRTTAPTRGSGAFLPLLGSAQ